VETTVPDEDVALGPMIGLRSVMATLRHRRRVWLATGFVGLIVGASLPFVIPHKYSAVTDLYLSQPAGSDPTQAVADDVSLLKTQAVAEEAISAGHLHMTPNALLSHYSGLAVSGNLMSIKFGGTSQMDAVSGARAVAQAFLTVQARELALQTNVLVRDLQSQISDVNSAISNLNHSINDLSGAAANQQSTNQLADLVNQRSADESQVSQLQDQVQQAQLSEQTADHVSHVLDPAALVPVSTKKVLLVDALSGLIVGVALGLAGLIFSSLLSERPLDRSTVAATLGAPVELSVGRYRSPRLMRRRRLSRQLREPTPSLLMIERRLRGHLESAPGSALAVVTVGAAEPAALAVGALALALSAEGHRVVVVDAADDRLLASILGLTPVAQTMETFQIRAVGGPPVRVLVAPEDPAQMAEKPPPDDADALLVLATLDAAFGAEHLAPWVTDAVMILPARGVTLTRMGVSRQMLREAGISLRSVVLLGSDPQDETSGSLGTVDYRFTPLESAEASK
jgi:capsular polysaccharide biosynthesis protein